MQKIKPNFTYKGKIINILDGNLLEISVELGLDVFINKRFKLNRVKDAHIKDREEPCKKFLNTWFQKDIIVRTKKTDSFSNFLAEIYYYDEKTGNEISINDQLIKFINNYVIQS